MIPSNNAYLIIEQYEGFRDTAYPDPASGGEPYTIGYGHTANVKLGNTCTEEMAKMWLQIDALNASQAVNDNVTVQLNQNQFDALVSFVFNVGAGNFERSTLLAKLNEGNFNGAADQFLAWDRASGKVMQGLENRRIAERNLFVTNS